MVKKPGKKKDDLHLREDPRHRKVVDLICSLTGMKRTECYRALISLTIMIVESLGVEAVSRVLKANPNATPLEFFQVGLAAGLSKTLGGDEKVA